MPSNNSPKASRNIFNAVPQKSPATKRAPNPMGRERACSFDQAAGIAFAKSRTEAFVAANPPADVSRRGWTEVLTSESLADIRDEFLKMPVVRHGTIGELARERGVNVVVAIVPEIDETGAVLMPDLMCAASECIFPVRVLAAAGTSDAHLLLSERRWEIARRKISVPNNGVVSGPYLLIAAISEATGITVRARLWPVAVSPDERYFQPVRSGPERIVAEALWDMSVPFFSPLRLDDLTVLQGAFGRCWDGDLAFYCYLPDTIVLPSVGSRVGIFELFGMAGFEPYVTGQRSKKEHLRVGHEHRAFLAYQLELTARTQTKAALEVSEKIPRLFASWGRRAA